MNKSLKLLQEAINGKLKLEISDDGKGFDTNKKRRGIGITNMMTRTEALNGQLVIQSEPGQGCKLLVNLPLTP